MLAAEKQTSILVAFLMGVLVLFSWVGSNSHVISSNASSPLRRASIAESESFIFFTSRIFGAFLFLISLVRSELCCESNSQSLLIACLFLLLSQPICYIYHEEIVDFYSFQSRNQNGR